MLGKAAATHDISAKPVQLGFVEALFPRRGCNRDLVSVATVDLDHVVRTIGEAFAEKDAYGFCPMSYLASAVGCLFTSSDAR